MAASFTVRFDADPVAPSVARVFGLGGPESWGRWSNELRVGIHFERPLPPAFEARLACAVTPANVGRVMTVLAGGCMRRLVCTRTLREGLAIEILRFSGAPGRSLEIHLPDQERASEADPREVGLALSSIEIVPVEPRSGRGAATAAHG